MKTLNAKRISKVAAIAASVAIGLAVAGPITFQNVPIISNSGQPVAQIVLGSKAQIIDGVSAGNIAAAIGNLAYTAVPVTASVNQTQAKKVLGVQVSSSSYTLSNQQVWLNESAGAGTVGGTYSFGAVIGSVINRAVILNTPDSTKNLQGTGQYSYPGSGGTAFNGITASPPPSAYGFWGSPPAPTTPSAATTGGGVGFTSFQGASNNDNILQLGQGQVPGLLASAGSRTESEYLWITGFPVYSQQTTGTPTKTFAVLSAGGAYQAVFGTPIQTQTSTGAINKASFTLLGQNWTIINSTGSSLPGTAIQKATQTTDIAGGRVQLAASLTPLTTVYVGKNLSSGLFTVQLTDLGQPNSIGISPASLNIYYSGTLTNTTQLNPGTITKFNASGHLIFINVNNTFAGLYAYQKWAKLQIYTNVFNVTDGKVFNKTTNPGWTAKLLWTNASQSTAGLANALYSIVLFNTTPSNLLPGQSFVYATNPAAWKYTFTADSGYGSGSFDPVTITTSSNPSINYQNVGSGPNNILEPAQILTITSTLPGAFTVAGTSGSTVTYDLTPYKLTTTGNALVVSNGFGSAGVYAVSGLPNVLATNVILSYTNGNNGGGNWISSTNPLTVQLSGYGINNAGTATASIGGATSQTYSFSTNNAVPLNTQVFNANSILGTTFFNITNVTIGRALPGTLTIFVNALVKNAIVTSNVQVTLQNAGSPGVLYSTSGLTYTSLSLTGATNTLYIQPGSTPVPFSVTSNTPSAAAGPQQYFTVTTNEISVATNTSRQDQLAIGLDNSTAGTTAATGTLFQLNYSGIGNVRNNLSYQPSIVGSSALNNYIIAGFRTERGSKIASLTPGAVTINFAKTPVLLGISTGPSGNAVSTSKWKLYGPYGIGQATNIANVSIGAVTANIAVAAGSNFTISGIQNIVATPSVNHSDLPTLLKNLSSTAPLVVLDSAVSPTSSSNLVLVGSGFVNTLSAALQSAYNVTFTPSSAPIAQAYGPNRILVAGYYGNQTQAASNQFIQQLYAQATT